MKKQNIRKIIKTEYSRLVSLPLFWLVLVGLDAGDTVLMTIGKENELIVKPYRENQDEKEK